MAWIEPKCQLYGVVVRTDTPYTDFNSSRTDGSTRLSIAIGTPT